jgi:hypothetical protein
MSDLNSLNKRIRDFTSREKVAKNKKKSWQYAHIFNIAIDLCANIFVGLFIGLFIDRYFGSKPFGLVICLIISVLSAFKMIVKSK